MEIRQPFDLIAERERSSREHRERLGYMKARTVAPEAVKVTPHEEMRRKVEQMQTRLSALHPGDPGAVAALRSCLLDTLDVIAYRMDARSDGDTTET